MTTAIAGGTEVRETLRALAAPRRLVPIVLLCAAMVFAQASFSRDRLAVPLTLARCLAFARSAPVSCRVFLPRGKVSPAGLAAFFATGVLMVAAIGLGVPHLISMRTTFLTHEASLAACLALY